MKILFALVNAKDRPSFDVEFLWDQMLSGTRGVSGITQCERVIVVTEAGLDEALKRADWDVLHFVTSIQSRESAGYSTIALLGSDGGSRYLPIRRLDMLLAVHTSLKLVVIQNVGEQADAGRAVADALVANGFPAAVCAPLFRGDPQQTFLATTYGAVSAGMSMNELLHTLSSTPVDGRELVSVQAAERERAILPRDVVSAGPLVMEAARPAEFHAPVASETGAAPSKQMGQVAVPETIDWSEEIKRKRASGTFDVFLSHNSDDKAVVKELAVNLLKAGILPWLDVWELQPGQLWQPVIYKQIQCIRSAAICIGPSAIRKWQEHEIDTLLFEFVERNAPVIPVFLPTAPADPDVPNFLRPMSWVDFRKEDPPPLDQLIWGITGERPESRRPGS